VSESTTKKSPARGKQTASAEGNGQAREQQNAPRTQKPPQNKSRGRTAGQKNNNGKNEAQPKTQSATKTGTKIAPETRRKAVAPQNEKSLAAKSSPGRTTRKSTTNTARKTPVKIIPLGGLGEVGKNITAYECGNDLFLVDCGLAFPNEEMLGVDIVIPDFTYLEKNFDHIRGIVITHGHEDHIGGLAYLLKKVNIPVYATRLTIGLIEGKLKGHNLLGKTKLNVVKPGDTVKLGCMKVEFIRVNHSIPDACALAIHTPVGVIIQTGDFKVDYTPIQGGVIDLARFGELGSKGVLALLSDSTNAEKPGSTASERTVGESFERLFQRAGDRRMIIATFASNIHRVQQIINMAEKTGRKVMVSGRSMVNVCAKAIELGYLTAKPGIMVDLDSIGRYRPEQLVIVTTGSQGEPLSALTRMASSDHRQISITSNDFIIISATPIPGNEKFVGRVVNDLMRLGAEVIYERMYEVHVSGHACQDEIKLVLALTRPKFHMPVHGEYKHLKKAATLGMSMGIPEANIVVAENGNVIETDGNTFKIVGDVPAGSVLVDGLGVGDVGSVVLRDRKHLAEDGLMIVVTTIERSSGRILAGPDIVSRGFVYVRESEELLVDAKKAVRAALDECVHNNVREWGTLKTQIRDALSSFVYQRTKRRPMILPVIMEV